MFLRSLRRVWPSTYFTGAITVLSFVLPLPQANGKILGFNSPCALFNFTGIPCPGCGLTRSFVCCGHGLWGEAFAYHPLGPVLFALTIGYFVWSAWTIARRPPFPVAPRLQFRLIGTLAAVLAVFWGLRLAGVFPLPETKAKIATGTETDHFHTP